MIKIKNLKMNMDGKDVLNGIDLHLSPGDVYGLLGSKGAGKSSIIYALLGLRSYSSGFVRVLGHDPASDAVAIRRHTALMPEKSELYESMTAVDYLGWYGRLYGMQSSDSDLDELLEKVGLSSVMHLSISSYSKGMQQRLVLARALLTHPKLLILDESTSCFDSKGRREIHDLLTQFARENNSGVLICTRILDDVARFCNKIGIIDNGQTCIEGELGALLAEFGDGKSHLIRLESTPDFTTIPDKMKILGNESGWWRVQFLTQSSKELSALWGELWQLGWKIQDVRSDSSGLEALFMRHTGHKELLEEEIAQ